MGIISQSGFDAIDNNGDGSLDFEELNTILCDIANQMKIPAPTEVDIKAVLEELDGDDDGEVSKEEFEDMIM